MKNQNYQISWTDVLFIPAATILYFILGRLLPRALAVALSGAAVLLFFSLFEPRNVSLKRFILAVIFGGIVTYTLAALFDWPP